MNDESKIRRSITSVVLGKTKVMSYEDLEEAQGNVLRKRLLRELKARENVVESRRVLR
jgi:hypothetical protein